MGSLGIALPCRWAAVVLAPPAPRPLMHTQSRRAGPRGPRVREGEGLAQSGGEGMAP